MSTFNCLNTILEYLHGRLGKAIKLFLKFTGKEGLTKKIKRKGLRDNELLVRIILNV